MIFGMNFNQTEIPPGWARRFAKRIKLPGMIRGEYARLQGVATDNASLNSMLIQADNGHRKLHVESRKCPIGYVYGVYTY